MTVLGISLAAVGVVAFVDGVARQGRMDRGEVLEVLVAYGKVESWLGDVIGEWIRARDRLARAHASSRLLMYAKLGHPHG